MIKIELNNTNHILNFHYNNLSLKKGKEWLITDFLDNRIKNNITDVNLVNMYSTLRKKVIKDSNNISILTSLPNELEKFRNSFELSYGGILDLNFTTKKGKVLTYRQDLLSIFYYSDYDKWNAYKLAKKININVCPYCNRSYTFVLGNDFSKGTRFEYDHFFDKARYPYLALSFYNLVPSCHICNSNLKGSDKFEINKNIHPYLEGFGSDLLFTIKPKNINFINGKNSAYRVKFKKNIQSHWDNKKIKSAFRNIITFRINDLYNMHKDYINEIIQKSIVYNEDHIKDLFAKYNGTLFRSEDDVRRMVLGNYISEDEYSKRPLSKLTADISRELGILK